MNQLACYMVNIYVLHDGSKLQDVGLHSGGTAECDMHLAMLALARRMQMVSVTHGHAYPRLP